MAELEPEFTNDQTQLRPGTAGSAIFAFGFWAVYVGIVFLVLEIFFRLPF